ncbi:MAG: riboflavin synthase [bacterium]|nr:riboflavin synthase [bacterium]
MFTGIIKELGTVAKVGKNKAIKSFVIHAVETIKDKEIGQSIAVNGVCTTITELSEHSFSFDAIPDTLKRTNLKDLKEGEKVNLEPAMRLDQPIDGHLVQGHVDCEGIIKKKRENREDSILTIAFPKKIAKYLAFKGSITINGVSLTITNLQLENFSVELTPLTIKKTNFQYLKVGDKVNLEIDLIARYLERLVGKTEKGLIL